MPQVIEVRYANGAQLASLLTRLFGGQATYKVRMGKYVIAAPRPLTQEEIDSCR